MVIEHSLDDLKRMLGLVEVNRKGDVIGLQYSRWDNFEKRVLIPAREELCEIGILFEYEPVIQRRKTVGVKMFFNPTAESLDEQTFEEYKLLKSFPIKAIDKVDISRCRLKSEISKAIADVIKSGNYKAVEALVPRTRKERMDLFSKKTARVIKEAHKPTTEERELF